MIVLRSLGLWLMAGAFVAFVVDGVKTIASAALVLTPLGQAWFNLHPPSLNLVQAVVERYTFPFLWDPVVVFLLMLPGWLVFGVLGAGLYYLGRRRSGSRAIVN